jgi:hypothetical protein
MSKQFSPRLHILLARNATTAVVIRRGPSKRVATFLWDRNGDCFSLGQWMNGRIYERRSDLSPDGRHLIYFAMNGQWTADSKGSWSAVSRAPYLKAISFYPKGDCWEGGGLFLNNKLFWLNDRYYHKVPGQRESTSVARKENYWPELRYNSEDTGVYYVRLQRDGWTLVEQSGHNLDATAIFDKPMPNGWTLRKIAHEQIGAPRGKGCYWDEHVLIEPTGKKTRRPNWEWAEIDGKRLVWCEHGSLFAASCNNISRLGESKLLHDFGDYKFQAVEAPY